MYTKQLQHGHMHGNHTERRVARCFLMKYTCSNATVRILFLNGLDINLLQTEICCKDSLSTGTTLHRQK